MKVELNIDEMRKIKLFIATPMYGGMCHGLYTKSLMDTTSTWSAHGMEFEIFYLFQNEFFIVQNIKQRESQLNKAAGFKQKGWSGYQK